MPIRNRAENTLLQIHPSDCIDTQRIQSLQNLKETGQSQLLNEATLNEFEKGLRLLNELLR